MSTKADLVTYVAEDTGLTKKDAKAAIESVITALKSLVHDDEPLFIRGLGTFLRRERNAQVSTLPKGPKHIAKTATLGFRASKHLRVEVK